MIALFTFMIVIMILALVYLAIAYILTGISLQRMAKKLKIENTWMAWVPGLNLYLNGEIAGEINFFSFRLKYTGLIYASVSILNIFLSFLDTEALFIPFIIQVFLFILGIVIDLNIFRTFKKESAKLYTILNVISFSLLKPFLLLAVSNKEPEFLTEYNLED